MRLLKITSIATLMFATFIAHGQRKVPYSFRIDTLSTAGDSTLVKITQWQSGNVTNTTTCFLFSDCIQVAGSVVHGQRLFKKWTYAPRLVQHGRDVVYTSDGKSSITEYQYGKKMKATYLDKNLQEISAKEFSGNNVSFICTTPNGDPHIILAEKGKKCK